jgi:magnesium transporter
MTTDFITAARETKVSEILQQIRASRRTHDSVSHIYIVAGEERQLAGVVDLRDLVLAADAVALKDLMVSLVVTVQQDDMREDLAELFAKDHLLGVIHYRDIMRGLITHARA